MLISKLRHHILSAAIILSLSAVAVIPSACSSAARTEASATSFTDTIFTPQVASGFRIMANSAGEQRLEVYNPWQGSTADTSAIVIPSGGFGRLVCMSTTHLAMLDRVDALNRVVGVSGMQYITYPQILSRRDEIADVGYDGAIDYELLLAQRPELVLLYGVGGPSTMESKLRELGVPYVYIADYLEADPLGRAEWMVALAALAGVDAQQAAANFAPTASAYQELRQKVAQAAATAPKVMLNAPYSSTWYMPSADSYMVRLLDDAGADYIYKQQAPAGNASTTIDIEQASLLLLQADFWLNPGQATDLGQLQQLAPKAQFSGEVWNVNSDYWQSGTVHPDLILRDLVQIFHPTLIGDSEKAYYFQLK